MKTEGTVFKNSEIGTNLKKMKPVKKAEAKLRPQYLYKMIFQAFLG